MTVDRYARLVATGSVLPSRVVPNSFFESLVHTSDEWIFDRTGIRARHFAGPDEMTSSLATEAATLALQRAGVRKETLDLLILTTVTPDRPIPATSSAVSARLGLSCPGFDVNAGCAGFVYSLSLAAAQIRAGAADRILVVGSDVMSRVINMTDRSTCVLLGDGAGAVVLEPAEEPGVIDSLLALDSNLMELLTVPGGGFEEPPTAESIAAHRNTLHMTDGQAVFKHAVSRMADACSQLLDKTGRQATDVALVVAHQANARIITAVSRRLGLAPEQIFMDVAEVGNTSTASIPIALDHAWSQGLLTPGDLVLTVAFGAGLAWGANLIRWTAPAAEENEPRGTGE